MVFAPLPGRRYGLFEFFLPLLMPVSISQERAERVFRLRNLVTVVHFFEL